MKLLTKLYDFANSWTGTIILVLGITFFVAQAFRIPSGSMQDTLLIGDNLFVKKFSYGIATPRIPWLEVPLLPDFNDNGHLVEGRRPERGEIVVFRFPLADKVHYVKRCVAIGGDEVVYTKEGLYLRPEGGEETIATLYSGLPTKSFLGRTFVYDPYINRHAGIHYTQRAMDAFSQMRRYSSANKLAMQSYRGGTDEENFFYYKVPPDHFFMMGDNRDNSQDSRFWGSVPYKNLVGTPWFVYFSWDEEYKIRWNRVGRLVSTLDRQP